MSNDIENDYDRFFEQRLKAISKELKRRIIEQDSDRLYQPEEILVFDEDSEN